MTARRFHESCSVFLQTPAPQKAARAHTHDFFTHPGNYCIISAAAGQMPGEAWPEV